MSARNDCVLKRPQTHGIEPPLARLITAVDYDAPNVILINFLRQMHRQRRYRDDEI